MGSAAEAATIDLVAAYREEDFAEKVRNLELTMDFLQQDKDSHFTAKRTEDQIKLLAIQRELELNVDGQVKYIDMSLADTLHSLIALDDGKGEKKAKKLASEFKVSDKRFAWIKMRAFIQARNIQALDELSKQKKLPIPIESFVSCLVEADLKDDAVKFVDKLRDSRGHPLATEQITWYVKLEKYAEAVKVAVSVKDMGLVEQIQSQGAHTRPPSPPPAVPAPMF